MFVLWNFQTESVLSHVSFSSSYITGKFVVSFNAEGSSFWIASDNLSVVQGGFPFKPWEEKSEFQIDECFSLSGEHSCIEGALSFYWVKPKKK